jgi:hypothetical protein
MCSGKAPTEESVALLTLPGVEPLLVAVLPGEQCSPSMSQTCHLLYTACPPVPKNLGTVGNVALSPKMEGKVMLVRHTLRKL